MQNKHQNRNVDEIRRLEKRATWLLVLLSVAVGIIIAILIIDLFI